MNQNNCINNRNINDNSNTSDNINKIDLDSKLRYGILPREKSKHILPTYNYINSGNLNKHNDASNIDKESKLLYTPVLNQSKKSLHEYKCLNRFETLHYNIQNVKHVIPEFSRTGLGTRELYKKKNKNININ